MEVCKKPKVSDCQDLSVSKRKRKSEPKKRVIHVTVSKYYSFLSGLTVKKLHDLAREGKIYDHWSLRKANLIRLLDDRYAKIGGMSVSIISKRV